ncbi:hypothetical protein KC322_g82 [Hortaea werneckii]|nr:hypothetical protein KC322_g82 [Hortaea werneckii]
MRQRRVLCGMAHSSTKIGQFQMTFGINQEVIRLQISVHNLTTMQVLHAKHNLSNVLLCPIFRKSTENFDHLATKSLSPCHIIIARSALTLVDTAESALANGFDDLEVLD